MRPAAHPLDALDGDGDGRGVPQLEADAVTALRRRWKELNEIDLPTIATGLHAAVHRILADLSVIAVLFSTC